MSLYEAANMVRIHRTHGIDLKHAIANVMECYRPECSYVALLFEYTFHFV